MTHSPDVELRLPAESAYVAVLRMTTAGLAARLDFTLDDIEDLRMAVGEACALVLEHAEAGGDLYANFDLSDGSIRVSVSADSKTDAGADKDSFGWQVLTALTSDVVTERKGTWAGCPSPCAPASRRDPCWNQCPPAGLSPRPTLRSTPRSNLWSMGSGDAQVERDRRRDRAPQRTPTARQLSTREQSHALFDELADPATPEKRRAACREQLVQLHLPLVDHCARRFTNRGEPLDDLVQVGTIGLIKSVDRFDNDRGVEFSTYATPTILGEIKRYFRDKGWAIRVPRRLQELRMSISAITGEMSQDLGRSPRRVSSPRSSGCRSRK